jgi:hypothetical protein
VTTLDLAIAEELARVPAGPTGAQLRRRARSRRVRRAAIATSALTATALMFAVMLSERPAKHRVIVSTPPPPVMPVATSLQIPPLTMLLDEVRHQVGRSHIESAVVVSTTRAQAERALHTTAGPLTTAHGYIVEVTGDIVCTGCSVAADEPAPRGRVLLEWFDDNGELDIFGVNDRLNDLSPLGTVYRLPL